MIQSALLLKEKDKGSRSSERPPPKVYAVFSSMSLGTTVGSLLIASWFALALSGALLLQTYYYFRTRQKDDRPAFAVIVRLPLTS